MRWSLIFLMWSACVLATAADAQELSFDETVARALDGAPQLTSRAESAAALRELATSAGRLPDPELVLGIDNLPVEGPEAWSTTDDFMTMQKVGLMQAFPNGRKRKLGRERAAAEAEVADAELAIERLGVAREAAQAWIRSAAFDAALRHMRALKPEVELGSTAARAGVAGGRASTAEALAAEAAVLRLESRILTMEAEARNARADLARWIGPDADRPLAAMPTFDALPAPAAALAAEADRHGPLLAYEARLAAARADVELARAAKRPDWSAEVSYGKRGPDFSDMTSLEFRVGLPLFSGKRQDPIIAARSADLRRLEADRQATLLEHAAEVRKSITDWEQASVRLELYDRELLPLARQRAAAALAAYRANRGELQLALDAFEAESDLAVERALLADARGSAWAYLRYLDPGQLGHDGRETP
jgi:outer membrane protein TolC